MNKCILFTGAFSSTTSRAQYQHIYTICDEYETTVVVNQKLTTEYSEIIESAEVVHEYEHSSLFFPVYCAIVYLSSLIFGIEFSTVASGQSSISVLPGWFVQAVFGLQWIVLAWDPPEGKVKISNTYSDKTLLSKFVTNLNYRTILYGCIVADAVILSDESLTFNTNRENAIVAAGGVDCGQIDQINQTNHHSQIDDKGVLTVIYVGNMHYHRGIDILLKAVRRSSEQIHLVLIGPGPETAPSRDQVMLREELSMAFEEFIQFDNYPNATCEYLGKMPHRSVLSILNRCDLGICLLPYERGLPHFKKTYPIKIFEYMACSTAVLATDTEMTRDVLNDDWQLVTNDIEELSTRLESFATSSRRLENSKETNKSRSQSYCWKRVRESICEELSARGLSDRAKN